MATKRWLGKAQAKAQVTTITVGGTWSTSDTPTFTINDKDIVVTVGTDTTTANIATAMKEAFNGDTQTGTGDHTFSETGDNIPEFDEITATVSGSVVTLTGDTKGKPFSITATDNSASGTFTPSTTTAATGPNHWDDAENWSGGSLPTSGVNEQQTIDLASGTASGGTFTATFSGQTTSAVDYNASAATFQAALEALNTIGAGNVSVSGTDVNTGYVVTFTNSLGYQNVAEMTVNGGSLTGSSPVIQITTTQAGSTGDDVVLDYSDVSVLYGLSDASRILNSLTISSTYTGNIGLPKTNSDGTEYVEYRDDYLLIGATTISIGQGNGTGSGRIKINVGSVMTTVNVYGTGSSNESDVDAVLILGTNAYNTFRMRGNSSVGIAIFGGESATFATLDCSGEGNMTIGSGVTLTTVDWNANDLTTYSGCTTLTVMEDSGTVTINEGAITTLVVRGGSVVYNSTGTLATASVTGAAILDFSQDPRAKTVTNPVEIYSTGCQLIDPEGTVSGLIVDFNQTLVEGQVIWGSNIRLTRGATA